VQPQVEQRLAGRPAETTGLAEQTLAAEGIDQAGKDREHIDTHDWQAYEP